MRTLQRLTLLSASLLSASAVADTDSLALFRRWARSESPQLRMQAARTLRGRTGPESRAALLSLLGDEHPGVRAEVRALLVDRPPGEGPALARDILALREARARLAGLRALLARREDPTPFAADPDPVVRARALASGRVTLAAARARLDDRDARVRALALEAVHDPDRAHACVHDRAEEVRIAVARRALDARVVVRLLGDRSWRVRLAALRAVERLRRPAFVPPLLDRLADEKGRLRAETADVLERLTGAPFGDDESRWRRWWAEHRDAFVPRAPDEPRAARGPGHSVARITFRRLPVHSLRVCFVLDASRSMDKPAPGPAPSGDDPPPTRWDLVRRDLLAVLERLPRTARFNVILFRTGVHAWQPRLVRATAGARARCRRWLGELEPGGWTNLFDALETALSDDEVDALYVLTDGVPSRGAETRRRAILDEIAWLNHFRLVQINTVQAGGSEGLSKSWDGFLAELAAQHAGRSVRE